MKKFLSIILVFLFSIVNVGFTNYQGIGDVYWDSSKKIFDGTNYREQISLKKELGKERARFIEVNLEKSDLELLVISGDVSKKYTLDELITKAEDEGYHIVTAINADVFDMKSGVSKGMVVHNGELFSSGFQSEKVLVFDYNNKVRLETAPLKYKVKGTKQIKINPTSIEENKDSASIEYIENNIQNEQSTDTENNIDNVVDMENYVDNDEQYNENNNLVDKRTGENQIEPVDVIQEVEFTSEISFVNIPFGASKSLHLFSRNYGETTLTDNNSVEVIIEFENDEKARLEAGKTLIGKVKEIRENIGNAKLEKNQLILSSVNDTANAENLKNMLIGSDVEISIEDENQIYKEAKEVVGIYYSILKNGQIDTYGTRKNPRTAFGVKEDGSFIFYTLDGRQNNAKGLSLVDLAKHLKALGCIDGVNLDGGGSTAIYVRHPGKDERPILVNKPSDGKERKVANALLLGYKERGSYGVANISLYPDYALIMPHAEMKIEAFGSNDKFEKENMSSNINYYIDEGEGTIDENGIFTAGNIEEKVKIRGEQRDAVGYTEIQVVKNDLIITPSVKNIKAELNQEIDIDVKVQYGEFDVIAKDNIFSWRCDEKIGTIDENGIFKGIDKNYVKGNIYIDFEDYHIEIPVQVGKEILDFKDTEEHWARQYIGILAAREIVNGMGDDFYKPDDRITRAQFLALLSKTMEDRSAFDNYKNKSEEIKKIDNNVDINENQNEVESRGDDINKTEEKNEEVNKENEFAFEDVDRDEWYYKYIEWAFKEGIVNGVSDLEFMPNESITREQMCVILSKFALNQNVMIPKLKDDVFFQDDGSISQWSKSFVYENAKGNIVNGMPDGKFNPLGEATRAEAAKIVLEFLNIKDVSVEK